MRSFILLAMCVVIWLSIFWLFWLPVYRRRILDLLQAADDTSCFPWMSALDISKNAGVPRFVIYACLHGLEDDRCVMRREQQGGTTRGEFKAYTYRITAMGCQKLNATNKLGWRKR